MRVVDVTYVSADRDLTTPPVRTAMIELDNLEDLEDLLAFVRARDRQQTVGRTPPAPPPPTADVPPIQVASTADPSVDTVSSTDVPSGHARCDECGEVVKARGLGIHKSKAHGGKKGKKAPKARKTPKAPKAKPAKKEKPAPAPAPPRGGREAISEEKLEKIQELAAKGTLSHRAIAREVGVSDATVHKYVGVSKTAPRKGPRRKAVPTLTEGDPALAPEASEDTPPFGPTKKGRFQRRLSTDDVLLILDSHFDKKRSDSQISGETGVDPVVVTALIQSAYDRMDKVRPGKGVEPTAAGIWSDELGPDGRVHLASEIARGR